MSLYLSAHRKLAALGLLSIISSLFIRNDATACAIAISGSMLALTSLTFRFFYIHALATSYQVWNSFLSYLAWIFHASFYTFQQRNINSMWRSWVTQFFYRQISEFVKKNGKKVPRNFKREFSHTSHIHRMKRIEVNDEKPHKSWILSQHLQHIETAKKFAISHAEQNWS
jgi:hypothetical protein